MEINYLAVVFITLFNKVGAAPSSPTIHQVSNCTGQQMTLTCAPLTLIRVKDIVHGQSKGQCSFDPSSCYELDKEFHPCTGAQTCRVRTRRRRLKSCGWSSYMTLTYQCVPAKSVSNICAEPKTLTDPVGYLATPGFPHSLALPASLSCTLSIVQPSDHLIKIYILDYGSVQGSSQGGCESQVKFKERSRQQKQTALLPEVSLCLDSDLTRNQLLYKSISNQVQVSFTGPLRVAHGEGSKLGVLIYYKASAADAKAPIEPPVPNPVPFPKAVTELFTKPPDMGTTGPQAPVDFFLRPIADISLKDIAKPDYHLIPTAHSTTKIPSDRTTVTDSWLPGIFVSNSSHFNVAPFIHDSWWEDEEAIPSSESPAPSPPGNDTSWSNTTTPHNDSHKIASTLGGVLFGMAMLLLVAILVILYVDRHRSKHHRSSVQKHDPDDLSHAAAEHKGLHSWLRNSCLSYISSSDEASTDSTGPSERGNSNLGYHSEALDDCQIPSDAKRDHEVYTIDLDESVIHEDHSPPTPVKRNSHKGKYETTVTIHDGDVTIMGSMEYLPPVNEQARTKFKTQLDNRSTAIYEEPCVAVLTSDSESSNDASSHATLGEILNLNCSPAVYELVERDKNGKLSSGKRVNRGAQYAPVPRRPVEPPPPKPRTQKPPLKPKPRMNSASSPMSCSLTKSATSVHDADVDSNGYVPCRNSQVFENTPAARTHHYSNHKLKKEKKNKGTLNRDCELR